MHLLLAVTVSASAQLADDMNGSVVADVGDYNYTGSGYAPMTAGGALEGAFDTVETGVETVQGAGTFLQRATSFGLWDSFDNGQGFVGVRGGMGFGFGHGIFRHEGFGYRNLRGIRLGPLYVGEVTAGAGLMYSEYQGRPLKSSRFRPGDDPWAAIVWTSFRVSAYATDTFAISLRPFVYWLPLEGKVGYTGIAGFFGFQTGLIPNTLLEAAYHVPLNTWDLYFYDRFSAVLAQASLLDEPLFYYAGVQDVSSYDTAGRYGFGGFGVPIADSRGTGNFSINDNLFDNDRLDFRNTAGATLSGMLEPDLRAAVYYRRTDRWDENFGHLDAWNTAGALLAKMYYNGSIYGGYNISSRDQFDTLIQWAYIGANAALGPRLWVDGRVGYMWNDGPQARESWIAQLAVQHQLGPYTWHGLSGGRIVTEPDFGSRYLADYIRYYVVHDFTDRVQLRLFAQYTDAERLDGRAISDYSSLLAGVLLSLELTPRDSVTLLNTYETYDLNNVNRDWTLWTHRLAYIRRLSEDCTAQFYYQYQHGNANVVAGDDFTEHLLYLGIVKQF